jgi:hypothetical protein
MAAVDPRLYDFCTERQREYLEAWNEHGSAGKAAKATGWQKGLILRAHQIAKKKAALHGYCPDHDMHRPAAPGFHVKGTSTLYDKDGHMAAQWVKTQRSDELALEALQEFVRHLAEDVRGASPKIDAPQFADSDLLAAYPMGDPHFGMYAWGEEAGEDFNLEEAERVTCDAVDRLVATAPPAETGLLLNLGDFFHADNSSNRTPQSGHVLDVDTRHAKVMQVGLRALVYCIKRLLQKHRKVIVRNNPGNHDPNSAFMLALCLSHYFENEPRVTVDMSPSQYWYYRFGKVLIASHHGDGAKMADLPLILATDRAEDWGATLFRYFLVGHIHHKHTKEFPGVTVEAFRTLAARDAWHSGMGYRSGRDMHCIVFHRLFGEIQRSRCDIAMLA